MKTQHPKQPPTHKIDFLLYRKTERGIFRLNSAGEWVRSTIDPDDFRRQAKKLTEKEIYPTPPPPPKKNKNISQGAHQKQTKKNRTNKKRNTKRATKNRENTQLQPHKKNNTVRKTAIQKSITHAHTKHNRRRRSNYL